MENLKPFDLQKALSGDPICYRNGEVPPEWKYFESCKEPFPLATVNKYGEMILHTYGGRYHSSDKESKYDLFMLPKKKTLWYCVYQNGGGSIVATHPGLWESAEKFKAAFQGATILAQHTIDVDDND